MQIYSLLEEYLSLSGLADSTKRRYRYMIKKFIEWTAVDTENISLENVKNFLNHIKN